MSLVQLVFEAVGAPATADAVKLVTAALDATVSAATRATAATTATVPATDALTAAAKKEAEQLATTRDVATSLNLGLVDMAAIVQAKLTPAIAPATAAVQGLGNASAATSRQVAISAAQLASQANASRTSAIASDYFAARQSAATPTVTAAVVAHRSLREQLSDMSAVLTDKLTPRLDPAARGLLALGAAALTARAAWGLFTGVLSDGSHFTALQARTGETIRNLVVIENAFKNAGVAGEGLTRTVSMIDSVLDGLDARGKKSDITLARLGTTVAAMKVMGLAEQLATLRAGFAGIETQAERAQIVMQLFGREGGQLLQVLGNPAAWSAAEANASTYAAQIERNAERFRTMEKNVDAVRLQLRSMAAAALEQVVPALDTVTKLLGAFNGAGLGTVLGAAGPTAALGAAAWWGVDKLDLALLSAADNFKGSIIGAISAAAARVTGILSAALPLGLAAAVAGQLIAGVMQARQDAEWKAMLADMAATSKNKADAAEKFSGAQTEQDVAATAETLRSQIATLKSEQSALAAEMAKVPASVLALENRRNFSDFSRMMVPVIGTDYTGSDGRQRNYTADLSRSAALVQQITDLEQKIKDKAADAVTIARTATENRLAAELAAAKATVAPLLAAADEITKKFEENRLAQMAPAERVAEYQSKRGALEQQLAGINPGLSADEKDKLTKNLKNEIYEITKKQHAAEKEIADTAKRANDIETRRAVADLENKMMAAKLAGNELLEQQIKEQILSKRIENELQGKDLTIAQERVGLERQAWQIKQAQEAARKQVDASREETESKVYGIRLQLAALDADYTRTTTEKWGERKAAIEKEVAALTEAARLDKERADIAKAAGDYKAAEMFGQSAKQNARGAIDAQGQLAQLGPDPQSWSDSWSSAITRFREEWTFSAKAVTDALVSVGSNGLNTISQQVAQTAVVTGQWGSLLGNISRQIGVELVAAIVKMGIQYTITALSRPWADKLAATASLAAMLPIATATSLIWSTPATLATIASMGAAAASAPAQMGVAIMASKGLALASDGGYFPGDEKAARGIFHGDEYIFSAPAVRRLGPENLERLHQSARSGSANSVASAMGGGGGTAGNGRPPAVNIFTDPAEFARMVQEHSGDWFIDMSAKLQRS